MRRQKQRATRFPGVWSVGEKYRIRIYTKDPKTGLPREIDRVIPAESAADASKQRAALTEPNEPQPQRTRLKDYAASWLLAKERELKASTVDRYATAIDLHIVPDLGDYYLDSLTHQDVVDWRDAQDAEPSTVNSRLRILKEITSSAAAELPLKRDPAARVRAQREASAEDDNGALLTAEELHVFLDAVQATAPKWFPLLATLALTAMRVGEATALRWDDIEETAGTIRVRRGQWRGQIDTTKTETKRRVPLPAKLAAILRDHRRELVARQHPGLASGWVFPAARRRLPRPDGSWPPVSTSSLRKPLMAALAAAELSGRITTHGLRRTWNNLLRQVTAGEVVRSITGHVTERMTEHYSHVHQNEKAQAATRALSLVQPLPKPGTLTGTSIQENG